MEQFHEKYSAVVSVHKWLCHNYFLIVIRLTSDFACTPYPVNKRQVFWTYQLIIDTVLNLILLSKCPLHSASILLYSQQNNF